MWRDVALVCVADGIVGLSFGAIAAAGHLDWWVPVLMSLLVFAGGSQFASVAVVLSGGSALTAVIAGLVLNSRMLPYSFALADAITGPWWRRMLGAQLITDEATAFALRQKGLASRRAVFWGCGALLFIVWNISVVLGVLGGALIHDTDALGLDAAAPVVLFALVAPLLKERRTRMAALVGAVIATATSPFLPSGLPVLAALLAIVVLLAPVPGGSRRAAAHPNHEPADEADR